MELLLEVKLFCNNFQLDFIQLKLEFEVYNVLISTQPNILNVNKNKPTLLCKAVLQVNCYVNVN